ncbi:MAG: hypothetical protein JWN82_499 [Candidatus Saccharibacteria bacterium]|nr:hypothetical protein [Candidatus Saccharibacteria bacterium]
MQNKKTKNQLRKNIRRMHERVGAVILIAGTLIGIVAVSTEARRLLSDLALRPAFAVIEHTGKESETARHPVRLDDALRAPHISGF